MTPSSGTSRKCGHRKSGPRGFRGPGIVVANIDTGVRIRTRRSSDNTAATSAAARSTTTTTGGIRRSLRQPEPHPCDNNDQARTRWARWSATTAGPIRSAWRPMRMDGVQGLRVGSCTTFALLECGDWILAPCDLTQPYPIGRNGPTSSTIRGARTGGDVLSSGRAELARGGYFPGLLQRQRWARLRYRRIAGRLSRVVRQWRHRHQRRPRELQQPRTVGVRPGHSPTSPHPA